MTLRLDRADIGFSAAHFSLLEGRSERLHGHNYRVALDADGRLREQGTLVDFGALKAALRAECAELHERTLLPGRSPEIEVTLLGESVEARCGDRRYVLPREDVVVLPVVNTTCECLAAHLLSQVRGRVGEMPVRLRLRVDELPGQGAEAVEPAS